MTTTNNSLLRTLQLTTATLTLSLLWLVPQGLAHGNPNAPTGCSARALSFSFCYGSIISFSQGNRVSTPGQPFVVEWGSPLTPDFLYGIKKSGTMTHGKPSRN